MLDRRSFLLSGTLPFVDLRLGAQPPSPNSTGRSLARHIREHPLAITMWDFSWLERRWPGAGYEDWDQVLSELRVRGYQAVRIDAYPHLIAHGAEKTWELKPEWNQQDWAPPLSAACRCSPLSTSSFARADATASRWGSLPGIARKSPPFPQLPLRRRARRRLEGCPGQHCVRGPDGPDPLRRPLQ